MSAENYVIGSVAKPLRKGQATLPRRFRSFSVSTSRQMQKLVQSHTPTDTGALLASIEPKEVLPTSDGFEGGVKSDLEYASFVEDDTRPHRIPKEGSAKLAFGGPHGSGIVVKHVLHPGTKGQHMFAKGSADMDAILPVQMERMLEEWAKAAGL